LVISAFYSLDAHDVRVDAIEENLTASPRIIVPAHWCADDEMGSSRSGLMMCCEDVGGMACLSHREICWLYSSARLICAQGRQAGKQAGCAGDGGRSMDSSLISQRSEEIAALLPDDRDA
jgi:hypothetical protein